ncbi:hypothetical protein BGZ49_006616, partial [Haplosporangium sp. Z 27]
VNGENDVVLPKPLATMKPIHTQLFEHAVDSLKEFQAQKPQEKDIVLLKDAQIAMSCVLNTMSVRAYEHFDKPETVNLVNEAKTLSIIPDFGEHASTKYSQGYISTE